MKEIISAQDLLKQVYALQKKVAYLTALVDQDLPLFLNMVSNSVSSVMNARSATRFYDHAWFAGLKYSFEAKQQIALALIKEVSRFNDSNIQRVAVPPLWYSIVEGKAQAVNSFDFVYDPDLKPFDDAEDREEILEEDYV